MALTVNINLTVDPLSDDVWFANAQAWANYWRDAAGTATIDAISVLTYTEKVANSDYSHLVIDGVDYLLVNKAQFEALNDSFKDLRAKLKDAGLIDY